MLDHYAVLALLAPQIPLWLKLFYTIFVFLLIPVYWVQYGPDNFLWFSDIALIATVPALWFESALLASMMTLAVGLLELAWNVDFFGRLVSGASAIGLSSYMFDPKIPIVIRSLSLFHVALPMLLFWLVYRLGYDSRALVAQTLLAWLVLLCSYLFTRPSENINWVYGFRNKPQQLLPARLYVALLMVLFPLVIYLPTHFLLQWLFG